MFPRNNQWSRLQNTIQSLGLEMKHCLVHIPCLTPTHAVWNTTKLSSNKKRIPCRKGKYFDKALAQDDL